MREMSAIWQIGFFIRTTVRMLWPSMGEFGIFAWISVRATEPKSQQKKDLCKKWGFRGKSAQKHTFAQKVRKKCCTLLGALSGIGGNPLFAKIIFFCDLGSVPELSFTDLGTMKLRRGSWGVWRKLVHSFSSSWCPKTWKYTGISSVTRAGYD